MTESVRKCSYCPSTVGPWHRDHVVPYSRGGTEKAPNIVWACALCNLEKSNKLPSEWLPNPSPEVLEIERVVLASIVPGARQKRRRKNRTRSWQERFEDIIFAGMKDELVALQDELTEQDELEEMALFEAWSPSV